MRILAPLAFAAALSAPALAAAQPAITVAIGPALAAKTHDYGAREIGDLRKWLGDDVSQALARAGSPPVQVALVIEDAIPNRPTFEQLANSPGLSLHSHGVGGARISGTVTGPDGVPHPIHAQYFTTDITDSRAISQWGDAQTAFEEAARDVAQRRFNTAFRGPGPAGDGHFGYPYTH